MMILSVTYFTVKSPRLDPPLAEDGSVLEIGVLCSSTTEVCCSPFVLA